MKIPVKILLSRGAVVPTYATDGSAAVDLRAALPENEPVTIAPGWKVTEVYGDGTFSNSTITLPENSGCILLLGK